jgi:hypothetical protein
MFLILGGLPPLLLPTDETNRAAGAALTGAGVFFQLESLGLIPWTFEQIWPVLLIAVGAYLVLRAPRGSENCR